MATVENTDAFELVVQEEAEGSHDRIEERGAEAWLTVTGSTLVYFASFGVINSFGFFQDYYQSGFLSSYAPSTIAFIGTLQITLMYAVFPVARALFDAFGLKYLYPTAALGCSGSLLALSFTKSEDIWQQFLTQGLLFGATVAFGVQTALTVVGQHFKHRRALAMCIVAGGSSIGGVCMPIMFSRLIPIIGFGWSLRIGALISLICYAAAMCISRAKHAKKPLKSLAHLLDFNGFKDRRYIVLAIGTFVASLGVYVPYYYVESFVASFRSKTSIKGYLLPLINAASFFGRILGGLAADRLGRLNLLYPMTILSGVLCYAMWLPAHSAQLVIAFTCLYGFCSGIFISVTPAAIGQITPDEKLGARLGAFFSTTAIATLVGTPIGGALIQGESRGGYRFLIIFAASTLILGGAVLFLGRILCERNLGKKW